MLAVDAALSFAGWYTVLGALTLAACLFLLHGHDAHVALSKVCLYICTLVIGARVWALWFAIRTDPYLYFNSGGRYEFNWAAIEPFRAESLLVAWPFMALAGHCFIVATGCLVNLWSERRNRMAVVLCGVTLCAGLLCPFRMLGLWQEWRNNELTLMIETKSESRRLADDWSSQFANEYPGDWHVLYIRANYLADVGRFKEAEPVAAEVLRLLPPEMETRRTNIANELKRITNRSANP